MTFERYSEKRIALDLPFRYQILFREIKSIGNNADSQCNSVYVNVCVCAEIANLSVQEPEYKKMFCIFPCDFHGFREKKNKEKNEKKTFAKI